MGKGVDHISTKKMGVSAYSRCPLCKEDEESIDHLLLHCPTVWGFCAALISPTKIDLGLSALGKRFDVGLDNLSYY